MFPLRPGDDEAFEDDVQPELDQGVVDRLSAYTSDEVDEPVEPVAAYPGLTDALFANRDLAVEDGHDVEPTDMTGSEPDELGKDASFSSSDEPEPAVFSAASWSSELTVDAVLEQPAAEASPVPDESGDEDVASLEPSEPGLPTAEARGVEHSEDPVDVTHEFVEQVPAVDEAPSSGASDVEEPERSSRRSFRRRRREHAEAKPRKSRAAKEKRGSKDRKAKRLVGLKIGASQIVAAEVVNNGAPELVEVFREPLEPGVVVQGEIRDPETLGAALKRLFELHKLPKRGIRLGVANNRIGVRIFEIEGVDDAQQLDNAIRFRAEEVLPIPLDEAVLDYVVLEDAVRDDGTPWRRILLVVAYREVVDRYLQACRSAGLEVVGIDLEAFALLRAIEPPTDREPDAGALVAVSIGHDRTTIAVSTGRYCEFTRVLDWGGWSLNVAIARELDRAPSEVEGLKRQLSFGAPTDVEGFTPEQTAKAREAVQRSLSAFVRELVASLQFYQAQPGALGIGEVVLTGGTAHMEGMPEALGELVGVPIRLGDPFRRLKVGPNVAHEGARGSLSVAIGLGIED